MITKRTTLVLGAGASWPYGFPTGAELKAAIISDTLLREAVPVGPAGDPEQVRIVVEEQAQRLCTGLRHSGRQSIDAFLEGRPDLIKYGKLAIAAHLLPIEMGCCSFTPRGGHWYEWLFERMYAGLDSFSKNALSIVTFNYDRSFELFMTVMLSHSSDRPLADCWNMVKALPIVHVYGALDSPIQFDHLSAVPILPGGAPIIERAAQGVRIITEERRPDELKTFARARELIYSAERLIFLGFGYDRTNLQRVGIEAGKKEWGDAATSMQILGMAFRRWEAEIESAQKDIGRRVIFGQSGDDSLQFLRRHVTL